MRKALFAVMLVAASFAGGAVANGPGLRWAQAMILDRLGGDDDGGDAQVVTPAAPGDPEPIPSAPVPKLDVELPPNPGRPDTAKNASGARTDTDPFPFSTANPPTPEPKAPAPPESKPTPLEGEPARSKPSSDARIVPAKTQAADGAPAPLEPLDPLPLPLNSPNDTGPGPGAGPGPEPAAAGENGRQPAWADVPGSAPAAAVAPRPFEPPGHGAAEPKANANAGAAAGAGEPARPSSGWAEIRRKMAALGVSRYAIEGEPNGKVRFHCVIPLVGRGAVAHQFEAEGDDDLQAAEIALRRVALWRATESPGP